MSQFKLGKLTAKRPYGLSDLATYAVGKLPAPPASCNYSTGLSLPIDGNDQYGDCVMAGTAHLLAAWNAEVKQDIHVPNSAEVVKEYFVLTGGQDSGLNESDTLQTWYTKGLFGNKLAGYAPVNHKDLVALHQATAFYGGMMLGIQCPQSAQEQFQSGKPWTYEPNSPIEGGHCIDLLGYSDEYAFCATWGGIARVTYPFLSHFLDEAYCAISQAFVDAKKGPLLDLTTLTADLKGL